jgi:hypothetical protein
MGDAKQHKRLSESLYSTAQNAFSLQSPHWHGSYLTAGFNNYSHQ